MDSLFQRTLEDLIKGLRLHQPSGESSFISKAVDEIRREIKSTDLQTKSTALQKLTYLHSLHGLDMSWAAFHAVEVTSSQIFPHKKIGYLAASLSFHSSTDVLLLLTNQLRKDLSSSNQFEVSLALECLSIICTPDLARDLTPDIFTLLGTTSKNFIKKKAIATLLKVFDQYPDAVRVCVKRLVDNLESSDMLIVSATVSVFCELATRDPKSYLPLAPEFYKILVDSRNNWVLIKVLKVFAKLCPLEPRLAKRVVEPVCDHIRRSGAKSLVFECVRMIVTSLSDYESAVRLAVGKIKEFLVEDDPNLKYLGLQGLSIVRPKHLWAVLENKEVVIKSLSNEDQNIKLEALRLVMAMVSEDNVAEICRVLINYALKSDPEFCNEILRSILSTCSRNVYEIIIDFDWYVSLLGEMSRIPHCQNGEEIENQLIDIGMRVKDVRPELVHVVRDLLIDPALLGNPFIHRILSAAAWVSGEYVEFSNNPFEVMEALLQPRTSLLPPLIRAVYVQSAFKVLTFCLYSYLLPNEAAVSSGSHADLESEFLYSGSERECPENSALEAGETHADCRQVLVFNPRVLNQPVGDIATSLGLSDNNTFTQESIVNLLTLVESALSPLAGSHDVELQERVRNILGLTKLAQQEILGYSNQIERNTDLGALKVSEIIRLMYDACSEELGPVSVNAQQRVRIPDGLVLEENLNNLDTLCGDVQLPIIDAFTLGKPHYGQRDGVSVNDRQHDEDSEPSTESTSLLTEHRKRHGLFYLPSDKDQVASTDYPPANDPKLWGDANDDVVDLVKLTDESLVLKRRPNQAKPRPVVVKLDEGDGIPIAAKKVESKDDLISGAVRDILLGNETIGLSSQSNRPVKSSSKTRGKEHLKIDQGSESIENSANMVVPDHGTSSSRRSKHRKHGKERKQREENGERDKRSGNAQSRHKPRQRAVGDVNVVAQTPVIPDFLL